MRISLPSILCALCLVLGAASSTAQSSFHDTGRIEQIEINFSQTNWRTILRNNWRPKILVLDTTSGAIAEAVANDSDTAEGVAALLSVAIGLWAAVGLNCRLGLARRESPAAAEDPPRPANV